MAEILIDTNILVYAHQPGEATKYPRALRAIEALTLGGLGCVSAQVLAEFVSATARRRGAILSIGDALDEAGLLADALPVLEVTKEVVLEAFRGVRQHRLSLFDAQLWATARLNQVPTIFTEDFTDGRRLEGVRFVNPLTSEFDLGRWS